MHSLHKKYRQNSSDTPWIWFAWDCSLFCHGINHHLVGTFLEGFQTFYRQIQDIGMFRFGQNPTDQLFWFKKICFWRVHPSQHCRILLQSQTPLTPRAQGFFFPPWSRVVRIRESSEHDPKNIILNLTFWIALNENRVVQAKDFYALCSTDSHPVCESLSRYLALISVIRVAFKRMMFHKAHAPVTSVHPPGWLRIWMLE